MAAGRPTQGIACRLRCLDWSDPSSHGTAHRLLSVIAEEVRMSTVRCNIGVWWICLVSIGLAGCAGQMPSMAPFLDTQSASSSGISITAQNPKTKDIEEARSGYPRDLEDMRFNLAGGVLAGKHWKIGGQVAFPIAFTAFGGYLRDPIGVVGWVGTGFTGVSGGSALIQKLDLGSKLTIGVYEYVARNEMVLWEYSGPSPLGGSGWEWPVGSRGYLESGLGSAVTLRFPQSSNAVSLEGRYGWDCTNKFRRLRITASLQNLI